MLKIQFYSTLLWSAVEAELLALALRAGSWFFAGLLAMILGSNVSRAYRAEKFAKEKGLM